MTNILGLDVGGANLKAAHTSGVAVSRPFALWRQPQLLTDELRVILENFARNDVIVLTMTGELCDCFPTSRDGVRHILDAVCTIADRTPVRVWRNDGRFTDPTTARNEPRKIAAANWLALATFAGRFAPLGPALLIDIGSTTADFVPLRDGRPVPTAFTDPDRLKHGELVYTGVTRTPVCALLGGGGAAEFFATTRDVYLLLDQLPEAAADCDTADHRPATKPHAHNRLARMICGDGETVTANRTLDLARRVHHLQLNLLDHAFRRVVAKLGDPAVVIHSGTGEFLARLIGDSFAPRERVSLAERLGPELSAAAAAYAVAVLAAEDDR